MSVIILVPYYFANKDVCNTSYARLSICRYAPAPDEEALDFAFVVNASEGRFYVKVG